MAGRDRFLDLVGLNRTFTIPGDASPSQIFTVLNNIRITVWKMQADGNREASAAIIYSTRSGTVKANPFTTGTNGRVDFFADPGEYEIDILDLMATPRISPETWHWSAVPGGPSGLDVTQLPSAGGGLSETGDIKMVGWVAVGGADPNGWLWCDGRVMVRTTYAALFAKIGTSYNTGGETGAQFRIPDMRGRTGQGANSFSTAAGSGSRLTSNGNIGNAGGAEKHTLTIPEMPSHDHAISAYPDGGNIDSGSAFGRIINTSTATSATGGGQAHNNMHPFQCVAHLIKT